MKLAFALGCAIIVFSLDAARAELTSPLPGGSTAVTRVAPGASIGSQGGGTSGTAAFSITMSSCTQFYQPTGGNPGPSFTCNLEPTSDGTTLNDIVTGISFPNDHTSHPTGCSPISPPGCVPGDNSTNDPISPGYVVLLKQGSALDSNSQDANMADWTQVLRFVDNGNGLAISMSLYTLGCNNGSNPNDFSCFPSFAAVSNDLNFFDFEPSTNVYVYSPGDQRQHAYTINFVPESVVAPEPATVWLLAPGMIGIFFLQYRTRVRRKVDGGSL